MMLKHAITKLQVLEGNCASEARELERKAERLRNMEIAYRESWQLIQSCEDLEERE